MKWYYDETYAESIERSVTDAVVNIKNNYRKVFPKDENKKKQIKKFEIISGLFGLGLATAVLSNKLVDTVTEAKQIETPAEPEYVTFDIPGDVPIQNIDDLLTDSENQTKDNIVEPVVQPVESVTPPMEMPVQSEPIVQSTIPEIPKEEPVEVQVNSENVVPVVNNDTNKANEIIENKHAFETSNEDVIGKAKEIIAMDTPSGSIVLDEYLKHHDADTNEALLGTLLYIDPYALNNNITDESAYLRSRGLNPNEIMMNAVVSEETQGRGR